jgi:hypothetical protein
MDAESAWADEAAAWKRVLRWSALALTACLVVAGILFALVEFGVIEGPGAPAGIPNDYPTHLGFYFADQRVVFPYEIAGAVLFSIGFLAFAGIGLGLRSMVPARDPMGTMVAWSFAFAAGLLVVSQLVFVGAKRVAIDPAVCECKYAPEQLISQDRTLEMIYGVNDWLVAGALLLAGLGMLAIPSLVARSGVLSTAWGRASQLLSILFFLAVLGLVFEVDIVFQLIAAVGSIVLLPAWALWLDRQLAFSGGGTATHAGRR